MQIADDLFEKSCRVSIDFDEGIVNYVLVREVNAFIMQSSDNHLVPNEQEDFTTAKPQAESLCFAMEKAGSAPTTNYPKKIQQRTNHENCEISPVWEQP